MEAPTPASAGYYFHATNFLQSMSVNKPSKLDYRLKDSLPFCLATGMSVQDSKAAAVLRLGR